jgi:hypothetical protein
LTPDCCWGTQAPSRSHGVTARASVSIFASCTGPHVFLSPGWARLCAWTAFGFATHSFQIQRQRSHSTSSARRAVFDTRTRKVYRACPDSCAVRVSAVMYPNLPGRADSWEFLIKVAQLTLSRGAANRPGGDCPFPALLRRGFGSSPG